MTIVRTIAIVAAITASATAGAQAKIDWQVTVYADGGHNAFTDLAYWNDAYYICFRQGEHHLSMDGVIRVLRSDDMKTWEPCGLIRTLGDDRDPHFAQTDDRLFVYFGVWDLQFGSGTRLPDRGSVRSHVAYTTDGETWSDVQGVFEPGWWLWRVRHHEGMFYSLAYTAKRPRPTMRETLLLRSKDGLDWERVSLVTNERMCGEADLRFNEDGSMWVVSRTGDEAGDAARFESDPSLMHWKRRDIGTLIHAPAIANWGDRFFVAGRGRTDGEYDTQLWEINGASVTPLLTLPSGGDTSYPGLLPDKDADPNGPPAFYITWYSQHEARDRHEANIYAARITLDR